MTDPKTLPIRTALPHEASAIAALARAAYAKWVPVLGREPRPMQADYETAITQHRFDVIEMDGKIVASLETEPRSDHYWIESVAVAPDLQGQGVGRRLLAYAEHLAREAGLSEMRLLTNGKMMDNRKLYVSVGYTEDLEEPFGDGTVVYLSKRLG
jgi:N-acetylglutamate synthase-like GNAT family acetyltransferase